MLRRSFTSWALGVAAAAMLAPPVARGGDLDGLDNSLKLIPSSASFYSSMLRNREQIEAVLRSRAWARLWSLPLVQMGWAQAKAEYEREGGKLEPVRQFYAQEENRELMHLLADALSQDVFIYGGGSWPGVLELAMRVNANVSTMPLKMQLEGNPRNLSEDEMMGYAALKALADNLQLINIPDLVIGFRVKDVKRAQAQLKRLEALLDVLAEQAPPPLRDRFKKVKVGDGTFLTLMVDGSLVPWEQVQLDLVAAKEGEFQPLVRKLRSLQLTVAVGLQEDNLLLSVGASTETVAQLGKGELLRDRAEVKPLARFADRKLTSISYVSKDLLQAAGNPDQYNILVEMARLGLQQVPNIPDETKKQIARDLASMVEGLKQAYPTPGALLSFSFLTDRGSEGYTYSYTKSTSLIGDKPLALLQHLGGNPILAAVSRTKSSLETYLAVVKWLKVFYGHVDSIVKANVPAEGLQQYETARRELLPIAQKLDEITVKMLYPSLADGQWGLLLDSKWSSKRWHQAAPVTPAALPLPELGLLLGVSDPALFEKAFKEYRTTINQLITKVRALSGPGGVPPFEVPPPLAEKRGDARVFFYPIPEEAGLDKQVQPTAGVKEGVGVLTFSMAHTERLLRSTPLKVDGGPLADPKRPLAGALYFDFNALVDTVNPWVEYLAMATTTGPQGEEREITEKRTEEILKQVRVVLEVLKCLKGATSATWLEEGVVITHTETVVRDLPEK